MGTDVDISCIAFGDGTFVTAGEVIVSHPGEPSVPMWASSDGVNWTPVQAPLKNDGIAGITYGDQQFVVTTTMCALMTSPDGITWTVQKPGQSGSLTSISVLTEVGYGNNTFVAVGGSGTFNPASFNNGVILTSSDGANWNNQSSGIQGLLVGVAYGNQAFVAVGCGGVILTSQNGQTWTSQSSGTQDDFLQVTYGNDTFVVAGYKGIILQSGAISQNSGQY